MLQVVVFPETSAITLARIRNPEKPTWIVRLVQTATAACPHQYCSSLNEKGLLRRGTPFVT
jgi:hypothetical protein